MIWPSKVGMVGLSIKKNRLSNSSQKNSKKGFTLVELIVVLVILAIMAAAVIPALLGYTDHAKDKKYIETAKECLKASQTVLSDTFTESGNSITKDKRYSAADMAKVSVEETSFIVWTAKRLEANGFENKAGTKATIDNQGAYTIVYAAYDTGTNKYVVYDGNDWVVKEKDSYDPSNPTNFDLAGKSGVSSDISNNIIHMWKYDETDACCPAEYSVAEDWDGTGGSEVSRKVILNFVNAKDAHGVVLEDGDGNVVEKDYSTFTVTLNFKKDDTGLITCEECPDNTLTADSTVKVDNTNYKLSLEGGFIDLKWSMDKNESADFEWTDSIRTLLGEITFPADDSEELDPINIYAWTTKEKEEKDAIFKVTGSGNLTLDGGEKHVKFYRYKNKYDRNTYEAVTPSFEGSVSPVEHHGYKFKYWAFNTGTNTYETEAGNLVQYKLGTKDIWDKVFATEGTPTFTAVAEVNKNITLRADDYSGFKTLTAKELELTIYKNDLTGDSIGSESNYNSNKIKMDYGYRFLGWKEVNSGDEIGKNYSDIEDYVMAGEEESYTFDILDESIRGAKIIGGANNNKTTAPGAIRLLCADVPLVIKSFVRDDFSDGVRALGGESGLFGALADIEEDGTIKGKLNASGSGITGTLAKGSNLAVYDVTRGSILRAAVLWDGNNETYEAPIFAYSVLDGLDVEIHWFSFEPNPEVFGSLTRAFDGFNYCSFVNSGIDDWNMKECSSTDYMFNSCYALTSTAIDFKKWGQITDEIHITTMANMFNTCNSTGFTTVDMSGLNMPRLTTMKDLITNSPNVTTVRLDRVKTPMLTDITYLLQKSYSSVVTFSANEWEAPLVQNLSIFASSPNITHVSVKNANLRGVTTLANAFYKCPLINDISFEGTDLSSVTSMNYMFKVDNDGFCDVTSVSFKDAIMPNLKDMERAFYHCQSVTEINIDTNNVIYPTNLNRTFDQCHVVTKIEGLDELNTINTTDMENMFYQCEAMGANDVPRFNYGKVESVAKMFMGAAFDNVDLSNVNLTSATKANGMFRDSVINTLSLKNCDMSNVIYSGKIGIEIPKDRDIYPMFYNAKINSIDLKGWKINVTNGNYMFSGFETDGDLTFDGENQNFSSATTAENMFNGANIGSLNMTGLDLSSVTTTRYMFKNFTTEGDIVFKNNQLKSVKDIRNMFDYTTANMIFFDHCDLSKVIYPSDNNSSQNGFVKNVKVKTVKLEYCDMSGITDERLAKGLMNNTVIEEFSLKGTDIRNAKSINSICENCTNLKTADFSEMNITSLTRLSNLFKEDKKLVSAKVTIYTTGKTSKMELTEMFRGCVALTSVSFGSENPNAVGIDTSCIISTDGNKGIRNMFGNCTAYTPEAMKNTFANLDASKNTALFRQTGNTKGANSIFTSDYPNYNSGFKTGTPVIIPTYGGTNLQVGGGTTEADRRLRYAD